jgi:hypothetical protein
MNTNWREYLKVGDKVLAYTQIDGSIILFRSILMAVFILVLLGI